MGKRIVVILAGLALAAGLLIWYAFFRGNRPFADLEGSDLRAASVRLSPPDVTFTLTEAEREELAGLLQRRSPPPGRQLAGVRRPGGDLLPDPPGRHHPHGDGFQPLPGGGRGGLSDGARPL